MVNIKDIQKELSEVEELLISRNTKYGDSWKNVRIPSLADYVIMKYQRLNKMTEDPIKNHDKIRSDAQDAIGYAIFILLRLNEEKAKFLDKEKKDSVEANIECAGQCLRVAKKVECDNLDCLNTDCPVHFTRGGKK